MRSSRAPESDSCRAKERVVVLTGSALLRRATPNNAVGEPDGDIEMVNANADADVDADADG
jgi:hypothetical protein